MSRTVPDLLLERYRLGELPEPERQMLAARLAAEPPLQARLDALSRSDDEIRQTYEASRFARPVQPRRRYAPLLLGALTVAAALLVAMVVPRVDTAPAERVKGASGAHPSLAVYRRTAAGSERLADGDVVRPGDLVRVGYDAGGRPFGAILSIDGRGVVTRHLPAAGERAVPLGAGHNILLDGSYELDDAPRVERFYFVTGSDAFALAPVIAAVRGAAAERAAPPVLALPAGLDQVTFTMQKEDRQ